MGLGGLIVAVVVFLVGFTPIPEEIWWRESKLVKPFEIVSIWSSDFLGEGVTKYHSYEKAAKND